MGTIAGVFDASAFVFLASPSFFFLGLGLEGPGVEDSPLGLVAKMHATFRFMGSGRASAVLAPGASVGPWSTSPLPGTTPPTSMSVSPNVSVTSPRLVAAAGTSFAAEGSPGGVATGWTESGVVSRSTVEVVATRAVVSWASQTCWNIF